MLVETHSEYIANTKITLLAMFSSVMVGVGSVMPVFKQWAEDAAPFLQDGAYLMAIISGAYAIIRGNKRKKTS